MNNNHSKISVFIALALSSPSAFGAGIITVATNGSGEFQPTSVGTGSWVSSDANLGTVTPNLDGTGDATIVSGVVAGGTLSGGNYKTSGDDPLTWINGDRDNTGIVLSITFQTTGDVNRSFDIGGKDIFGGLGDGAWRNLRVTNMLGIETLTVTYSFDAPVAAVRGSDNDSSNDPPFLVGVQRNFGSDTFNGTATVANLTVDGAAYNNTGAMETRGDVTWNSLTATGSLTGVSSPILHALTRFDIDGGGVAGPTNASVANGTVEEIERTYATGMTWVIENADTTPGAKLEDGSEFTFSFNGMQYEDTFATVVPEPSSIAVCMLGLSFSLGYRRRKH